MSETHAKEPPVTQTTREALNALIASRGLESVLDALRMEIADQAAGADESDQDALYEAASLVEQAWMALPECGGVEG
jgi:hypothetical protein